MHFHSRMGMKIEVRLRRAVAGSTRLCCIISFESVTKAEKDQSERIGLFLVGEDGFEPSKRYAADLQSVPFGHSGTPPYSVICYSEPVWSR